MGKLIFRYTEDYFKKFNREASEVSLTVPDDMTVNEYKVMCMRLASAIGYTEKTIDKAFGDVEYDDDDKLSSVIKEALNDKRNKK
jgi:Holliday junction resolvasome RuvABC DNA-binding subunit